MRWRHYATSDSTTCSPRATSTLRCVWVLGCPAEIRPHADAVEQTLVGSPALTTKEVFKQAFQELMPETEVPELVGVSCCSQFAVSRETVHRRPKEEYIQLRKWLLETELADDLSGRVLEYAWHSMSTMTTSQSLPEILTWLPR